ncbi:MAG: hypothetical protein M1821_005785 [Bathelium mastoideum]|nr:MAG: hypothetical protein M1821_005785 [Bathelium mastoideum]KAI9681714.1 MAG: hypothetical protein M1822_007066 [Bathelium mastoideum]
MTTNSNDQRFHDRLRFVKRVFTNSLRLKAHKISPIAYEKDFPFPYNNFVYAVDISVEGRTEDYHIDPGQPGTQPIPSDTSRVIIRLPNLVSGYNDDVRVENEVAALSMAREALRPKLHQLVPRVFAWSRATEGQGWILQECMPGEPLLKDFQGMKDEDQAKILGQMADILACFQAYKIPGSVQGFGGLRFGPHGEFHSAPLSIFAGGPFSTYEDLVRKTIESKLQKSENDAHVQGWRDSDVRERLESFLARGLHQIMSGSLNQLDRAFVHADFSVDNLLYNKATLQVTAVVDFDFAHVATIADEFFRSLGHEIGRFPDTRDGNEESMELHRAMLQGFPESLPANSDEINWTAARTWDTALRRRDIQRPGTIPDMALLADLYWLSSALFPFKLCNEVVVGNSTSEQLRLRKEIGTEQLRKFLADYGF